jgi:hypothetical protein
MLSISPLRQQSVPRHIQYVDRLEKAGHLDPKADRGQMKVNGSARTEIHRDGTAVHKSTLGGV